ncbi:MAG: aspartyl/asparaginyl beta-hydroxylase domain-containing protein [Gammaproteobacteria bacterium]|nr:aspartyl/asparaginyl beta-hydroxylase domain-containing protein [Gammaproteobacteria bacterium]
MTPDSASALLQPLLEQARQCAQTGAGVEAAALYGRILAQAPDHAEALDFMGLQALAAGHVPQSIAYFERALATQPQNAATWKNLALAQAALGKFDEALKALDRALELAPLFPAAWLNKGAILEQSGEEEKALGAYLQALGQAEQTGMEQQGNVAPPRVTALLQRARAITRDARKRWIYRALEPLRDAHGDEALARVDRCIESHFSASPERPQQRLHYPTFLYFPGLPERGWFDRADFPWLEKIETHTNEIRQELGSVLGGDEGFRPFVEIPRDLSGAEYWREVNQSPNWNAFFFYRDGERHEENCRRCPVTAAALDSIPISRVAEHSPEAFFSVLKPGVHIPIHTGVVNVRLVTHLPLVIPPDCGIRVNGEARGWNEGECIVFDDTFEHEAWNGSDTTRVVLIFDIWNPRLTEVEQQAMKIVIEGFSGFRHAYEG